MKTKAFINFRETHPELLARKDRGRPTEANAELKAEGRREYGVEAVYDHVPGAEVLDPNAPEQELIQVSSLVIVI